MSALGELQQALRTAEENLERAQGGLARGRRSLTEAEAAMARIDPDHPDAVVPPALHRADDQIERTLNLVEQVIDTLRDYSARL